MDIRLIVVMMVVALIMDMLGRMARRRNADAEMEAGEDGHPGPSLPEGWERPEAWELAQGDRQKAKPARERTLPRPVSGGAEADPVPAPTRAPVQKPAQSGWELSEPASPTPAPVERVRRRSPTPWVVPEPSEERSPHRPAAPASAVAADPEPSPSRRPELQLPQRLPAPRSPSRGRARDVLTLEGSRDLRRAVILREVLGPPVALRDRDRG